MATKCGIDLWINSLLQTSGDGGLIATARLDFNMSEMARQRSRIFPRAKGCLASTHSGSVVSSSSSLAFAE